MAVIEADTILKCNAWEKKMWFAFRWNVFLYSGLPNTEWCQHAYLFDIFVTLYTS